MHPLKSLFPQQETTPENHSNSRKAPGLGSSCVQMIQRAQWAQNRRTEDEL